MGVGGIFHFPQKGLRGTSAPGRDLSAKQAFCLNTLHVRIFTLVIDRFKSH